MDDILISAKNIEYLMIANSLIVEKKPIIAGLIGASVFESIIEEFEDKLIGKYYKKKYGDRIDNLFDDNIIDEIIKIGLKDAWEERNHIIHPTICKLPYGCKTYDACCENLVKRLANLFSIEINIDYEKKAKVESERFPGTWLGIGGNLPKELNAMHFSNLKFGSKDYMAPLGEYLQKECLNKLDNFLKFQTLSRVDYTSGYVWLSAVKTNIETVDYRSRVALPGLTVVLKPVGINVYIELPGKAIQYKKSYYNEMLNKKSLKGILHKSRELSNNSDDNCYKFFHTWWFADREDIREEYGEDAGYIKDYYYCEKIKELRSKWRFDELINERLDEIILYENTPNKLDEQQAITRNSFLIGRFYRRCDCINKYKNNLHEHIAHDFQILHPILEEIYRRTSKQT